MSSEPVFDRSRPYGDIFGNPDPGDPRGARRYQQDGHYFCPNGAYHSSDEAAIKRAARTHVAAITEPVINTKPTIDPARAEELLKDPRAEALLELPRDKLQELVAAANGPVIVGEGSHNAMVAFILANTDPAADEL